MGNMYYLSTYLYISEHNNPRVGWGSSLYLCMFGKGEGLGADWNYSLSLCLSLSRSLISHVAVPKDSSVCYVGMNVRVPHVDASRRKSCLSLIS